MANKRPASPEIVGKRALESLEKKFHKGMTDPDEVRAFTELFKVVNANDSVKLSETLLKELEDKLAGFNRRLQKLERTESLGNMRARNMIGRDAVNA